MGEIDCLKACSSCGRHVRCHERSCPFCGVALTFFMRVPDYRLKTRLGRNAMFSVGAALGAIGFALGCSSGDNTTPLYGAACVPDCNVWPNGGAESGGGAGSPAGGRSSVDATSGAAGAGVNHAPEGAAGEGGEPSDGGAPAR